MAPSTPMQPSSSGPDPTKAKSQGGIPGSGTSDPLAGAADFDLSTDIQPMTGEEIVGSLAFQDAGHFLEALPASKEVRFASILAYIYEYYDQLVHQLGGIDPFIVYVHELYDRFIAPIDIPGVPDLLEKMMLDPALKKALSTLLRGLHDRAHPDIVPPSPPAVAPKRRKGSQGG